MAGAELPGFQSWKWGLWGTLKVHEHRESLPLPKSGAQLAACLSKANKEARLVEMKICFILDASNSAGEGEADTCSNADLPPDNQGARAFIDGGRNSTVSSDSLLEIGHQWSDQHRLDCFRYN